MTARKLPAISALERARSCGRLGRAVGLAFAIGCAVALGRLGAAVTAAYLAAAWVILGAPWRMLWRAETSMFARLPIAGVAMYRLLALRSARAAAWAAVAFAATADLRVLPTGMAALAIAIPIAPAATVVGVAMAGSRRVDAALAEGAGAGGGGTMWITLLPALAWFGLCAALHDGLLALAIAACAAIALHFAGEHLATSLLPRVIARYGLARVRLAHVDLVTARGLEALWGRIAAGPAMLVYRKNVALLRRRFPVYYIVAGAAILTEWGTAIARPHQTFWICAVCTACITASAVTLARCGVRPPIEYERLRRTLPLARTTYARAGGAYLLWRAVVPIALGIAPLVRTPGIVWMGAVAAAAAIFAGIAAMNDR